jgi:ribonuclease HII
VRTDPWPALRAHDLAFAARGPVCGIDEAGRGPLAGNVVAACVILDLENDGGSLPGLNDSKRVSPAKRALLDARIRKIAVAVSVGEASPEEVDGMNILQATFLAMRRAIDVLPVRPGLLLVDGNQKLPGIDIPQVSLVGGDGLSASIAAASVLAKIARDRQLEMAAMRWPEYGFDRHKGYGTAEHRTAIATLGPTPIHRKTFLRGINTKTVSKDP